MRWQYTTKTSRCPRARGVRSIRPPYPFSPLFRPPSVPFWWRRRNLQGQDGRRHLGLPGLQVLDEVVGGFFFDSASCAYLINSSSRSAVTLKSRHFDTCEELAARALRTRFFCSRSSFRPHCWPLSAWSNPRAPNWARLAACSVPGTRPRCAHRTCLCLWGGGGVLSRHARAVRCELLHPSTSAGPHVRFGQPKRTENGVNGAIAKRPNN